MEAVSYESITVSNVAIGCTTALLQAAPLPSAIYVSIEDPGVDGIRLRVDGADPTAAEGHLFNDGDSFVIASMGDIGRFRAIRVGAVDVTIRVTYLAM